MYGLMRGAVDKKKEVFADYPTATADDVVVGTDADDFPGV